MPPIHSVSKTNQKPPLGGWHSDTVGAKQRQLNQLWLSRAAHPNSCSSPPLHPLSALLRDHQDSQEPALQVSIAGGSEDRKNTVRKQILILTGGVQLRRAKNKTVPARRGTQTGLVAPDSMSPL